MHGAEAVGDEQVGELGELVGELAALDRVLAGLGRVEADVLQQRDLAVLQRRDGGLGRLADGVGGERDRLAQQLAQAHGDRRERVLLVRLRVDALGAAQVRGDDDLGAALQQGAESGHRGADPAVVGDARAVERHVEVGAHQHALAGEDSTN